jgi:hypothetical protein
MKLLYYLAAIGKPYFETKIDILTKNLFYIYKDINASFDIIINSYELNVDISHIINKTKFPFLNNIYIHYQTGHLIELWSNNPYHKCIAQYDYILFILDDVEIDNVNIHKLVEIKNTHNLNFISPRVENSTWDYMKLKVSNTLRITNRIEIFCLLLNYPDFVKFLSINDIQNKNTWGVDYIMAHYKIKTGVYYNFSVIHKLPSNSNHSTALEEMHVFLNKHGYKSREHLLEYFPNDIITNIEL